MSYFSSICSAISSQVGVSPYPGPFWDWYTQYFAILRAFYVVKDFPSRVHITVPNGFALAGFRLFLQPFRRSNLLLCGFSTVLTNKPMYVSLKQKKDGNHVVEIPGVVDCGKPVVGNALLGIGQTLKSTCARQCFWKWTRMFNFGHRAWGSTVPSKKILEVRYQVKLRSDVHFNYKLEVRYEYFFIKV